jgi:hypothetical protein
MFGCTLQNNVTQRDSDVRDMEMISFEDMKISEQTDIKKSIFLESSSKKVQPYLLSSLDATSTSTPPFKIDSSPLDERDSKFGQLENSGIHSPEKVDSKDLNMKLRDSNSKPDQKIVTSPKKLKTSKKLKIKLLEGTESTEKQEATATFREVRKRPWFIDVTMFISNFHHYFGKTNLFLSPAKSGKTTTVDMLREFYWVPRIDVKSYDFVTKTHANMNYTTKDIFKETSIYEPEPSRTIYDWMEDRYGLEETFVEDNMNKWPVVVVDFKNVRFDSKIPTKNEIHKKLIEHAIQPAFEQYDYLIFLDIARAVWWKKYGTASTENYRRLFEDFELDKYDSIRAKINVLTNSYKIKKLVAVNEEFYKLYNGDPYDFDDIHLSLRVFVNKLKGYYKKGVIILVDSHDAPAQRLFENISFLNPQANEKLMESIGYLSRIITGMFHIVGKDCEDWFKFAMFGTSDALHRWGGSDFNSYSTHNFFELNSLRDFAMTEEEVVKTIDKLFPINEEQKKEIKSNIDVWYGGYFREYGSKLYQIYSTTRYLEDCYREYKKRDITPNEKDDRWIPSPLPYRVSSKDANLYNDYLGKGFSGEFYDFLLALYWEYSVEYSDYAQYYHHPFLVNPETEYDRKRIFTTLLIHGGYLTRCDENRNIAKIPNCEVLFAFEQKLKEHLNSIPIQNKMISSLSKAVIAEDFEKFGVELTKSVSKFIQSKKKSKPPMIQYIHSLMWKLFATINTNPGSEGYSNICTKLGTPRSKMDFHFECAETEGKTHYIIQYDELYHDENNQIEDKALDKLESIFHMNYHQHILEAGEAAAVVMMGIATHQDRVCLATLKVGISNGRITKAVTIKHQRFWMDKEAEHAPQVNVTEQREYSINMSEIEMKVNMNATEKENTELYNKKINQGFATKIDSKKQEAKIAGLKVEYAKKKQNKSPQRQPRSSKSKSNDV